jgi:hypothetical protein
MQLLAALPEGVRVSARVSARVSDLQHPKSLCLPSCTTARCASHTSVNI